MAPSWWRWWGEAPTSPDHLLDRVLSETDSQTKPWRKICCQEGMLNNPRKHMQTFLRHFSSGQYFQALDRWTPDRDSAHDFGLVSRATKFAKKLGWADLEVVLCVDHPQQLISTTLWQVLS